MVNKIKALTILATITCISFATNSEAAVGDLESLEGKTIVYTGDFSVVPCPVSGKYDCSEWPLNLIKKDNAEICFAPASYGCGYSCKGIVTIEANKKLEFYKLDGLFGVENEGAINMFKCPRTRF
jgi:hypothetical protein